MNPQFLSNTIFPSLSTVINTKPLDVTLTIDPQVMAIKESACVDDALMTSLPEVLYCCEMINLPFISLPSYPAECDEESLLSFDVSFVPEEEVSLDLYLSMMKPSDPYHEPLPLLKDSSMLLELEDAVTTMCHADLDFAVAMPLDSLAGKKVGVANKRTRQNYSSDTTSVLMNWFFENNGRIPNKQERLGLSQSTGKTPAQIGTWYHNASRRHGQKLVKFQQLSSLYPDLVFNYQSFKKYLKNKKN